MVIRCALLFVIAIWAVGVDAFRLFPFRASGRPISARNIIARPIAPKWKRLTSVQEHGLPVARFSSISGETEVLNAASSDNVREGNVYDEISKQKKDGVIQHFRSRVWSRVPWNTSTDTLLLEGVNLHGTGVWKKIAAHVGKSVTLCKQRWYAYLKPKPSGAREDAKWTEAEVTKLRELVNRHKESVTSPIDTTLVTPRLDWLAIGREMNRLPRSCCTKWDSIQHGIKGHYTSAEDSLILQRVQDWGDRGKGLWVRIAEELGRPASSVRARWLVLQCHKKPVAYWTEEMDAALLAARELELPVVRRRRIDTTIWEDVATRLSAQGFTVEPKSCSIRYSTYLRHALAGLRAKVEWTPDLVESLMEMRKQNMSWQGIGHSLQILPKVCSAKHLLEYKRRLKHGPFTAEEDALIRRRVVEWGNPTKHRGLWPALEKEMGRPSKRLRERWYIVLFHKDVL